MKVLRTITKPRENVLVVEHEGKRALFYVQVRLTSLFNKEGKRIGVTRHERWVAAE